MNKKAISQERLETIQNQTRELNIPYQFDTREYPIEVIVTKYNKDEFFVPVYQRLLVWDSKQKSRFIESIFLGVPIMPILVSISGDDAEMEIIDGSQRIRTLAEFIGDRLRLTPLKKLDSLNGLSFSQLPISVQRKFLYRDLRFHIITENATPEVRADIFDRINTSGKKLSDAEVRKGAYGSNFYDMIVECGKNVVLHTICPIPKVKENRGEYDELVLRFFAYSERYLSFKHDVAPFLNQYVRDKKEATKIEIEAKKNELLLLIDFIHKYFKPPYLARKGSERATARVRFEAIAVGTILALRQNPNIVPSNFDWLESEDFVKLTTSDASNNPGRLKSRIEFVRDQLLKESTTK